jgi:hypothetical protein
LILSRCLILLTFAVVFDLDHYKDASHFLRFEDKEGLRTGAAVAVTMTKALAALHGYAVVGQEVQLHDCKGVARCGTVIFIQFEEKVVDIALIELKEGSFEFCIPVFKGPVKLGLGVHIVGYATTLIGDEIGPFYESSKVIFVEQISLVRASYYSEDSLSGAGVIVAVEDGSFHVLGVHVGRGDKTETHPPIKKFKSGAESVESVSENSSVTSSNIHGHSSYSLICAAVRVTGLVEMIL